MTQEHWYDAVVIGSGFGGAVVACRLSEAKYKVLVLERGHRWGAKKGKRDECSEAGSEPDPEVMPFPRHRRDAWIWDHRHPERSSGWIDFRGFPHMGVAQGAGVGGGSLIYANILLEADPRSFVDGWPKEVNAEELRQYYRRVGDMLEARTVPPAQWSERVKLLKEAAEKNSWGDRFRPLELAVRFRDDLRYDSSQRPDPSWSRRKRNIHGAWQGTCAHLGNCDIGCEVNARNTLDKNYLFVAEKNGAEIRPRHLVRSIEPEGNGYRVHFDRIEGGRFEPGSVLGAIVVVAAGSLGSTELLLRCKEQYRTLPNLSQCLGQNWSSNGDFLTAAFHLFRKPLYPGRGIVFAGSLNFLDGSRAAPGTPEKAKPRFNIEDAGFPYQAVRALIRHLATNRSANVKPHHKAFHLAVEILGAFYATAYWLSRLAFLRPFRSLFERLDPINRMMPWVAQGQDAANGTLRLKDGELFLDWPVTQSKPVIDAIYETHKQLACSTGGLVFPTLSWTWFSSLITPHALGGCNMGSDPNRGVVNHKGQVFGYPRLYVADGAIVPEALGVNPAKTIAALAERIADNIIIDHPRQAS
jgi:cholesterol oxidase